MVLSIIFNNSKNQILIIEGKKGVAMLGESPCILCMETGEAVT